MSKEHKKKAWGKRLKIAVGISVLTPFLFVFPVYAVPHPEQIPINKPTAAEIEKIGERKIAEPVPQLAVKKKVDPVQAYQKSLRAYNNKKYDRAISLFKEFIDRYPQHSLADNASYWLAECFYSKSDFAGAVFLFKKMLNEYPQGNKVPDALLKIGYSYLFLNKPREAKPFLERVVREYPSQSAGINAEKKLKHLSQ
jgi:tol-pal system protein YbgF